MDQEKRWIKEGKHGYLEGMCAKRSSKLHELGDVDQCLPLRYEPCDHDQMVEILWRWGLSSVVGRGLQGLWSVGDPLLCLSRVAVAEETSLQVEICKHFYGWDKST